MIFPSSDEETEAVRALLLLELGFQLAFLNASPWLSAQTHQATGKALGHEQPNVQPIWSTQGSHLVEPVLIEAIRFPAAVSCPLLGSVSFLPTLSYSSFKNWPWRP